MTKSRKMTGVIGLILLNFMSLFMIASIGIVGYSMAAEFNAIDKVGLIFALETCFRCTVCPISGKLGEKVGRKNLLIGDLIEMQFLGNSYNINLGAAISLVLMVIVLLIMTILNQFGADDDGVMVI